MTTIQAVVNKRFVGQKIKSVDSKDAALKKLVGKTVKSLWPFATSGLYFRCTDGSGAYVPYGMSIETESP